jgi:hypothetical protein
VTLTNTELKPVHFIPSEGRNPACREVKHGQLIIARSISRRIVMKNLY